MCIYSNCARAETTVAEGGLTELTLTEAFNMAQNEPLWRLLAVSEHDSERATLEAAGYERWYARLVMQTSNDDDMRGLMSNTFE